MYTFCFAADGNVLPNLNKWLQSSFLNLFFCHFLFNYDVTKLAV